MTGLKQNTPISMQGLNKNINDNLIMGGTLGNFTTIRSASADLAIELVCYRTSAIILGNNSMGGGHIYFQVMKSDLVTPEIACKIFGQVDSPYLDMLSHKISQFLDPVANQDAATKHYVDTTTTANPLYIKKDGTVDFTGDQSMGSHRLKSVADPTTAGDALPYNAWTSWSPTLTWGTATPASLTIRANYVKIGKTVIFSFDASSTDSNGTTGLTLTLPIQHAGDPVFVTAAERAGASGTTWYPVNAWIGSSANTVVFLGWTTATDGQAIWVACSGAYGI